MPRLNFFSRICSFFTNPRASLKPRPNTLASKLEKQITTPLPKTSLKGAVKTPLPKVADAVKQGMSNAGFENRVGKKCAFAGVMSKNECHGIKRMLDTPSGHQRLSPFS